MATEKSQSIPEIFGLVWGFLCSFLVRIFPSLVIPCT